MNRHCKIPPPGDGAIPGVACASNDTHSPAKKFKNKHAPCSNWESAENYDGVLFYVSPKLRVAVCPDRAQFLIQRSVGTRHGQRRFEAFSYPTTKIALRHLLHTRHGVSTDRLMELTAGLPKTARLVGENLQN
jgi:hypothetical protein